MIDDDDDYEDGKKGNDEVDEVDDGDGGENGPMVMLTVAASVAVFSAQAACFCPCT